ncbi:Flp family type IVb pilin, partial [Endozoicomonas sp. ALE010]|uniref:Flp family type IVb pilin n=2 Tax=Endozoicomonas TaxID=305899 RepID=UPI003BB66CF1
MKDVFSRTRKRRQSGVAMSEYLPIVGLIAVMLIGGMGSVGDVLRDQGSKMAQEMAGDNAGHRLPPSNGNGSVDFPTDTSPGSGDEEETPDTGGGSGSEPDYGEGPDSGNENGNGDGSGGDDDGKPGEQPGGGNDGSGDNSGGNEAPSDEDLIEQIQQFVEGLWDGLKTQFWGIVDLLASPIETAKNMYALAKGVVLDPQGTIKEIADQFKDDITELLTGSAYERGKVIGENISPASLAGIAKKVLSLPSVKNRPLDVGCSSFTA